MGTAEYVAIALALVTLIATGIGSLLAWKDNKQAKEIEMLFHLHKEDAEKLARLELHVAGNVYQIPTVDAKFDKLETTIKDGFTNISKDIKEMTHVFHEHISHHGGQ